MAFQLSPFHWRQGFPAFHLSELDFQAFLVFPFLWNVENWVSTSAKGILRESRMEDKLLVGGEGQAGPTLPGSSSNLAIWCIFLCLALIRPLVSLCLAAMHLIWSSKVKVAERRGMFREAGTCAGEDPKAELELRGLWTVTCRQRESSLSVTTSKSCGQGKKVCFKNWTQLFFLDHSSQD